MFSFIYNAALFLLALIALPKILWQWFRHGKYKESIGFRFGLKLPDVAKKNTFTIWIHTISVGETRAVIPLFKKIRSAYPEACILISSITETGHAVAKNSMKEADAHFFLPLDFSFIIKRAVHKYHPDVLILVESDFWYHLLYYAKKMQSAVLLINGKISERSLKRFKFLTSLTKRLFPLFDHLCVQSQRYKERFLQLHIPQDKITDTGNIKLDASPTILTEEQKNSWKEDLGIQPSDRVLVIGSTHEREEEELLTTLKAVWQKIPELKVLIVPRHPERFSRVKEILHTKNIPWIAYTDRSQKTSHERVILIDAMGILNTCYQLAEVAIVAGSFTDKVGGHNIFEPVFFGVPVLFGPHMYTQLDLVQLVNNTEAGRQVSLEELPDALLELLQDPQKYAKMRASCLNAVQESKGSTERTWKIIQPYFQKKH